MTMAAQQAAVQLGFTNAWLWDNTDLSDVTLLLATKGGWVRIIGLQAVNSCLRARLGECRYAACCM